MLDRFTAELAAIMSRTASQLLLIVCDADVHQVEELHGHAGQQKLRNFKYKGGGGTDFRPAIKCAVDWRPDVLVYLTDLYGPCGDAPKFPVIWALPPGLPVQQPPWGLVLELS
jgi:predicted metal-dependent peptidase